ncbi:MAG: OmpH family outer membrane protein [Phycisphaeraceae bacterium]|nr:OmpH family outer membrane protein [Phycisphaeraceae bacterium]MCB9846998.1 OmpH family outer membrane protein [Phycisphaeraceae bacterium]
MRRKADQSGLVQWAFLFGFLLLAAGLIRSGTAPVAAAPVQSPIVATVRVSDVINGLDELKERESELRLFIEEQKTNINKLGDDLTAKVDEMNLMPDGSAQKKAAYQEAMRMRLNLEVEGEISSQLVDARRGEVYADIFKKISDTARALAQNQGYSLVLTDDSGVEIQPSTEQNVRAGILSRRVLYSDPSLDITSDLILTMNNAWKAGGH